MNILKVSFYAGNRKWPKCHTLHFYLWGSTGFVRKMPKNCERDFNLLIAHPGVIKVVNNTTNKTLAEFGIIHIVLSTNKDMACYVKKKLVQIKKPCNLKHCIHNWQKWKRTFLTCPCHKIFKGRTWSVFSLIHEIWSNFMKIWYSVDNYFEIKTESKNPFAHMISATHHNSFL